MVNQAESYLDHPMFQQAMKNLQNGDWTSGLDQVERLMQSFPLEPELRSLRQEMMLRAKVDADEKSDKSATRKRRFRDWSIRLAVIGILAILAIYVAQTYSNVFREQARIAEQAFTYRAVQMELQIKMRDAEAFLNAGRPDAALELLREIAEIEPEFPDLAVRVEEAEILQLLDAQYKEAIVLFDDGDISGALLLFQEIEAQRPYYRDVKSRIAQIEDQTLLGEQLTEADEYFANEEWEQAADKYYALYSLNPDFQTAYVEDRLFTSFVNAADDALNNSDTLESIQKVEDFFQRALAIRPQDPEVELKQSRVRSMIEEKLYRSYVFLAQEAIVNEPNSLQALKTADKYFTEALRLKPNATEIAIQRELAHHFIAGQDHLARSAYSDAIESMEIVVTEDPGYANGTARQTLYESYVGRGDDSMAIGDFDSALEDFQRAAVIANDDPSSKGRLYEIQMRIAEAHGLLGDYDTAVRLYQAAIIMGDLRVRAERYSTAMAAALESAEEAATVGSLRDAFRFYREAVTWATQVFDVVEHVVVSDDYLSQLALDYNSTVNLIAEANNLANPNIIIPGQVLLIPILP